MYKISFFTKDKKKLLLKNTLMKGVNYFEKIYYINYSFLHAFLINIFIL